MKSLRIIVQAENGLHARPVGEIVRAVKSYTGTTVTLATEAKTVNAASMLSVLSLGLKKGTEILIEAEGPQEEEAVAAVVYLIENAE